MRELRDIADEVQRCAAAWDADACLIGNVTAAEIMALAAATRVRVLLATPVATIEYWISAYTTPSNGPHFQGHGMIVKMLREYLSLRIALANTAPSAAAGREVTDTQRVDWYESNPSRVNPALNYGGDDNHRWYWTDRAFVVHPAPTFRAAVDAALVAERGREG